MTTNNPTGINQYTKGGRKGTWIPTRPENGTGTKRLAIRATNWRSAVSRANKVTTLRSVRASGAGNKAARKAMKFAGFGR